MYEKADYSKKYFFLPLQYENEAQQLFREPFLDQYAIIRNISKLLPAGVSLYVKTHPHLQGIDVTLRKLLSVAKLPNVRIVHHDENPVKLVLNSIGLVTINSTTGFEAIALGKPVIAFGHDWYAKEGIAFVVRDMMRLRDAICDIVENPSKYFDEEKRKEFVSGYLKQLMPIETPHRTIIRMKDYEAESIAKELVSLVNKEFI